MFAVNREKYDNKIPPSRYELDNKLRLIVELSNKLDVQYRQAKTLNQLFSSNLNEIRKQLSDEVSQLFRNAPIEYASKCEDLLWKRNYYDCVKFFKTFRKTSLINNLDNSSTLFRSHLISGIGHYHSLLLSFRKMFKNDLAFLEELIFLPVNDSNKLPNYALNNSFNIFDDNTNKLQNFTENNEEQEDVIKRFDWYDSDDESNIDFDLDYMDDEKFKKTLLALVYRFYICIGDLCRYYVQFFSVTESKFTDNYFKMASFNYKFASLINPSLGMPYNQLGTLYKNSYYGLDTLYYYFRSLNSSIPFPGTNENLKQTFELIRKDPLNLAKQNVFSKEFKSNGFKSILECGFENDQDLVRTTIFGMVDLFSQLFKLISELENKLQEINASRLFKDLYEVLVLFRNAINIENDSDSREKPCRLSMDCIFKMVAIIIVLIQQVKNILKKYSIKLDLSLVNFSEDYAPVNGDLATRGNYLVYISYHFLFQLITMVIHRECVILKKLLYSSQNLIDDIPTLIQFNSVKKVKAPKLKTTPQRPRYSQSFSSDFGDQDDALHQLRNTAFQTIQDVLNSSDSEDDDDSNEDIELNNKITDSDSSDENGTFYCSPETKTLDEMLAFIYLKSSTPLIKFFCDYLQSNSDFLNILPNMDVIFEFFEYFFQYLNIISEFDFRLFMNFKSYLSKLFQSKNEKRMEKLHNLVDLFNFINKCWTYSAKDFKQTYPLSSEMDYLNLTEELCQFYQSTFDCEDEMELMRLNNRLSIEKSSYLTIRYLLVFGIQLSLTSLGNENLKLTVQDFDILKLHNCKDNRHVSFDCKLYKEVKTSLLKGDCYTTVPTIKTNHQHLISFDDNEDKEPNTNSCFNIEPINHLMNNQANNTIPNNLSNESNKALPARETNSFVRLDKLPNILLDPFVYLDHLQRIKQIVQQKKAMLIVPKLVMEFLNNLKEKQITAAVEANNFLLQEFTRGSRMIRFINEERLELEMLNYPRNNVWNRSVDPKWDLSKARQDKTQNMALFYELLEQCHYLLVNKVLVINRGSFYVGNKNNKSNESNVRITLIMDDISKIFPNTLTSAQSYGIDIETLETFLARQNPKSNNKKTNNKQNNRKNNQTQPRMLSSSPNNRTGPKPNYSNLSFINNLDLSTNINNLT